MTFDVTLAQRYPARFPPPRITIGGEIDYGVYRNQIAPVWPDQGRGYGANPSVINAQFLLHIHEFPDWLEWIEENAIASYVMMQVVTNRGDFGPTNTGGPPLVLDAVTVVPPLQTQAVGHERVLVSCSLAVMPRDIDDGHLGVGGDTDMPDHLLGNMVIAGTPPAPSPDFVIAGTPAAPNDQNTYRAGNPGTERTATRQTP